jgi:integrative and conjugative element protein (TIGR02256 family)
VEIAELNFNITNGGRIKLSNPVIETLAKYQQIHKNSNESGGILLGRFIKESKDIVIDKITTPLKGDKQTRFSFKRLSPLHQEVINEEWTKSRGTINYLGEWHTHPENYPRPSFIDIQDWKRKMKIDTFSSRYLYFIIQGIVELNIWEGDRRTLEIKKLKKV